MVNFVYVPSKVLDSKISNRLFYCEKYGKIVIVLIVSEWYTYLWIIVYVVY